MGSGVLSAKGMRGTREGGGKSGQLTHSNPKAWAPCRLCRSICQDLLTLRVLASGQAWVGARKASIRGGE
jgi:hypothetical protein